MVGFQSSASACEMTGKVVFYSVSLISLVGRGRELAGVGLGKRTKETRGSLADRVDRWVSSSILSAQGFVTRLHILASVRLYLLETEEIKKFCDVGGCACGAGGKGEPPGSIRLVPAAPSPAAWVASLCPLTTRLCACCFPEVQRVPSTLERLPGRRDPLHSLKPRGWNTQRASNASKLPGTSWHANAGAERNASAPSLCPGRGATGRDSPERKGSGAIMHPNASRLSSSTQTAFVTVGLCPGTSARDPGSPCS